jgi:hypothetical protein
MIERLELLFALIAIVSIIVVGVRYWTATRRQATIAGGPDWRALGVRPDGRRTLIAFSTPSCPACHQAQPAAIDRARQQLEPQPLRLIRVDAAQQPEVARAFGIMTVPSTVVIAPEGHIVAINQGFAPSGRLLEQLQQV